MGKGTKDSSMDIICGKTGSSNKLIESRKYGDNGREYGGKKYFLEGYFFRFYENVSCNK